MTRFLRSFRPQIEGFGAACLAVSVALSSVASAQTAIDRVNSVYERAPESRRSDPALLEALKGLETPPAEVRDLEAAKLLYMGASGWDAAAGWAAASSQQRALDALDGVTRAETADDLWVFAQPYGPVGVDPELIVAGLYTDLGDPPLLAAARHLYLDKMDELRVLAHVEATRRAADEDPESGLGVLMDLAALGRQMADREMLVEATWGLQTTVGALRRMRDVLHEDFRGRRLVGADFLEDLVDRLGPEGAVGIERLHFPRGDRVAAEQLIEDIYEPRGGVDPSRFVVRLTEIAAAGRPLRRFGQASQWSGGRDGQADWFEAQDLLAGLYDDWEKRWELDRFDPLMLLPFEIDQADLSRAAVLHVSLNRNRSEGQSLGAALIRLKHLLSLERRATRQALALVGRHYRSVFFAPNLPSLRPRWMTEIEDDPMNPARASGRSPLFEYFVPIRDAYVADPERDEPEPHVMDVYPDGHDNFRVVLGEDQFVLYSVGGNGVDDHAERVSQDDRASVGDYLIWPPVLSLTRQQLRQAGELR